MGNSYPILLEKLSATGFSSLPVQEILLTPSSPLRLIVKNPSRKVNTISRESLFETEQQTAVFLGHSDAGVYGDLCLCAKCEAETDEAVSRCIVYGDKLEPVFLGLFGIHRAVQ